MRNVWRPVLVASVLLALCVGARAEETPVDMLLKLIKMERWKAAMDVIQSPPMKTYLEGDAKEARRAAIALDDASYEMAGADRSAAESTVTQFQEIATAVVAAFPEDPDAHIAAAHGHVALATLNGFGKKREDDVSPDPWAAAAASYLTAWEKAPDDATVLANSAKYLAFATGATAARAGEFRDESLARAERALAADPDSFDVRDTVGRTCLLLAESLLPSDAKSAKDPLMRAAEISGALYDEADADKKRAIGTTYNACVTLSHEHGLKLKIDYRLVDALPGYGIRCKVPDSLTWIVADGVILQRDRQTMAARRSISFTSYGWETAWQFGFAGEAGGDNMKGLAKCLSAQRATDFAKAKKQKVGKGRIGKGAEKGATVTIEGTDKDGKGKRLRAFLWKDPRSAWRSTTTPTCRRRTRSSTRSATPSGGSRGFLASPRAATTTNRRSGARSPAPARACSCRTLPTGCRHRPSQVP
jgi:hypothetical protein